MIVRDSAQAVARIICDGRPVDTNLTTTGPACGKQWRPSGLNAPLDEARAGGWAIGPDDSACCPVCRKPDRTPIDVSTFQSTEE